MQRLCFQVIQFAKDLALEEIEIETCGCLGKKQLHNPASVLYQQKQSYTGVTQHDIRPPGICGNGPNMVVDPPGTQLSHVSSPAKFVEVLDLMCNIQVPANFLKATEVSLRFCTLS